MGAQGARGEQVAGLAPGAELAGSALKSVWGVKDRLDLPVAASGPPEADAKIKALTKYVT